jgi:protoheme IX farnesyltransferase
MKLTAHAAPVAPPPAAVVSAGRASDFLTLTKPRLNLLVLITTLGGLYLASPSGVPLTLMLHTLVGTALVAGGAAALNQAWERNTDARMRRTAGRPLPKGRLRVRDGAWFGVLLAATGPSSSRSLSTGSRHGSPPRR